MAVMNSAGGLVLRECTDGRVWDELVIAHPGATPFHLSSFLTIVGRCLGLRTHLTVAELDGTVVGVVPLLVRQLGPVARVNHAVPFPYLGPLLEPGCPVDAVLPAVRRYLRPWSLLEYVVQSRSPVTVPRGGSWIAVEDQASAVVVLAGRDDDSLLGLLAKDQRKNVRQGIRRGLETGPATRQEIADHLGRWSGQALARQGRSPRWPPGAHIAVHDGLAQPGATVATAVRREGELLGVALDLLLGDRVIAWEIGLSETGRAGGVAPVLHHAMMRRARDLGAVELDLLGSPNPGIARYKRSLGAEFRPRGVARWSSSLLRCVRRVQAQRLPVRIAVGQ